MAKYGKTGPPELKYCIYAGEYSIILLRERGKCRLCHHSDDLTEFGRDTRYPTLWDLYKRKQVTLLCSCPGTSWSIHNKEASPRSKKVPPTPGFMPEANYKRIA